MLSALGLFSTTPGTKELVVGSPVFRHVRIQVSLCVYIHLCLCVCIKLSPILLYHQFYHSTIPHKHRTNNDLKMALTSSFYDIFLRHTHTHQREPASLPDPKVTGNGAVGYRAPGKSRTSVGEKFLDLVALGTSATAMHVQVRE